MSGRSLCPDGVMYKGGLSIGVLSKGVLSGGGFVPPSSPSGPTPGSSTRGVGGSDSYRHIS